MKKLVYRLLSKPVQFPLPYHGIWLKGWSPIKAIYGHELETTRFYERVLKPTDRVADVGAANGYYTCLFERNAREVVAFEANPYQLPNLRWAVKRSHIVSVAVGPESGSATLHFPPKKYGLSSIAYAPGSERVVVPVEPLRAYGHFDWVKIDVEGAEIGVLRGMEPTNCTVEFSPKVLAASGTTPEQFIREIRSLGYEIFFIREDGTYEPLRMESLPSGGHINLYLRPH